MGQVTQEFQLGGVNHLALVCSDKQRTVEFYSGVLGMPLIKMIELPRGLRQHFFFDCGNGDTLAFFWFARAPDGVPGISAPAALPGSGDIASAVGFDEPRLTCHPWRQLLQASYEGPQEGGRGVAGGAVRGR